MGIHFIRNLSLESALRNGSFYHNCNLANKGIPFELRIAPARINIIILAMQYFCSIIETAFSQYALKSRSKHFL